MDFDSVPESKSNGMAQCEEHDVSSLFREVTQSEGIASRHGRQRLGGESFPLSCVTLHEPEG